MKKKLLFLALLATGGINAQTIAAADTLTLGDSKLYYRADTSTAELENVIGGGTTWDYSGLLMEFGTAASTNTIIDISASPFATDFPNAQYHEDFPNGIQSFFTNTGTGVEVEGFVFNSGGVDYFVKYDDNTLNALSLPMSLGDVVNDNIEGTAFAPFGLSTAEADITGSATISADGTGTLLVGNNTYANTIRVKTVENASGPALFQGVPVGTITVVRTSYAYYSNATTDKFPIMVVGKVTLTLPGNGVVTQKIVWAQDDTQNFLSVDEQATTATEFKVFPNPAGNFVNVETAVNTESVKLFNTVGKLIKEIQAPKTTETIDVSALSAGVYFVSSVLNGETKTEKLIIK